MSTTWGSVTPAQARRYEEEDRSSSSTPEDPSAKRLEEGRQAEQRQSALASADTRGGISRRGASTVSTTPQQCDGPTEDDKTREAFLKNVREQNAKLAEHTAKVDTPIQSDAIGNALPGLAAGAVVGGIAAAAGGGIRHIASEVGKHVAEDVAGDLIENGAHHVVHELTPHGHKAADERHDAPVYGPPRPPAAAPPSTSAGTKAEAPTAGRTGASGTCEESDAAGECRPEPPAGRDRMPYVPGKAPLRIPEAPREDTVERPVVVAG